MKSYVVVPARMASTRLPRKPLAMIGGVPMIVRVLQQAHRSTADQVIAAVDHEEVASAVQEAGFSAEMTDPDHKSGSDRVMEVAVRRGWEDDDVVINVQGDEPLIPPTVIDQLIDTMRQDPALSIATLCEPIRVAAEFSNPNVVKVVRDHGQRALYFSRAPIPFPRDSGRADLNGLTDAELAELAPLRHVGVYAFRTAALRAFVEIRGSHLERTEMLEQLRWLESGQSIKVLLSSRPVPGGVDTPEDLHRVEALVRAGAPG